jgi:hypothetical protein
MYVRYVLLICWAGVAWAGTDPKRKPDDYEVHARLAKLDVGAEYMVHSFSGGGQTFIVDDYLVVEVALFPEKGDKVTANAGEFTLRIDGKRAIAVPASMVVNSMQRRQWRQPRGVQATGGVGDKVVILGGPPNQRPPYGEEPQRRLPAPPRAPEPDNPSGMPPAEKVNSEDLVVGTALPEGTFAGPVSGYLYFAFNGKASKIKTVDLLYGDAVLKLK